MALHNKCKKNIKIIMRICDCHNDFFGELKKEELQDYITACQKAGVRFLSGSFWTTKKQGDILHEIASRKDAIKHGKCFALHIEDLGFIRDEIELEKLIKTNPFSCSLTWNFDNKFAGGSHGEQGLTKLGENVIKKLENNHILFDSAHLNKKSFFDAQNISKNPPYISHTGFCFIRDDKRNLDEEQIKFIVRNKGFIGLFFYDKLSMAKDADKSCFSVKNIAENYVRFVDKFGCENIGVGSDFYGISNPPKNLKNYSQFQNLIYELENLGMSVGEMDKIFYKNFQNFLSKCKF